MGYKLTLKTRTLGEYSTEANRYNVYDATTTFDCESVQQLTGLLEFMVSTSRSDLDLTISREEAETCSAEK